MACEYTLYGTSDKVPRGVELGTDEVAIGAASAASANPFPAGTEYIVITPTDDCRIALGTDPTAKKVAPKTRLLKANQTYTFKTGAGQKLAAIAAA